MFIVNSESLCKVWGSRFYRCRRRLIFLLRKKMKKGYAFFGHLEWSQGSSNCGMSVGNYFYFYVIKSNFKKSTAAEVATMKRRRAKLLTRVQLLTPTVGYYALFSPVTLPFRMRMRILRLLVLVHYSRPRNLHTLKSIFLLPINVLSHFFWPIWLKLSEIARNGQSGIPLFIFFWKKNLLLS